MFLQKGKDPSFWAKVRTEEKYESIRHEMHDIWEKDALATLEVLSFSDFMLFSTTGDRKIYETAYFRRRRGMDAAAILALLYPEEPKYIERLQDIIFAICDEYTWSVPAHQPTFEENLTDHLDLFATETGFALCEIEYLLGDRLAPLVVNRIRANVDRRIILPYTDTSRDFWWYRSTNNWSAVCMCGVAACIMYHKPELFASLKPRFDATMDYFLSGFGDDGFCTEGIGYWNYGFGFFVTYADLVREFTHGECDMFRLPKVKQIATFMQKMFLSDSATVSFSDGQRRSGLRMGLMHYLHTEYPDAVCLPLAKASALCDNCGRWCLLVRSIIWLRDDIDTATSDNVERMIYAPDAEWYLYKTNHYGFAAKGGHNEESHNHNDIGHFILAKDGHQVFCDLGSGLYNRDYFRGQRYTFLHCASFGHSVPYFGTSANVRDAILQKNGLQFCASNVKAEDSSFSIDMAKAYGHPDVRSALRTFRLEDDALSLEDTFAVTEGLAITERFVLLKEPTKIEGGFEVDGMICHTSDCEWLHIEKQNTQEHNGSILPVWFVDVRLAPHSTNFTLHIHLAK